MDTKILVYGHSEDGESEEDLIHYLQKGLFLEANGRYRYSQNKDAHIIVIAMKGKAYGHLIISDKEKPTEEDINVFSKTKMVYIVNSTATYQNYPKLSDLGIKSYQFGKEITLEEFEEIKNRAGKITEYFPN